MKMRWRRAVAASSTALLLLLVTRSMSRGPQQPLSWVGAGGDSAKNVVVEQQNDWPFPPDPIVNPLPACFWDINDHLSLKARLGSLAVGAVVSKDLCMVSDYNPVTKVINGVENPIYGERGHYGMSLVAPSDGIAVTVTYQPQGRTFTVLPDYNRAERQWEWGFCSQVVYNPDDPALAEISGSNGGIGVITTITLRLENTTGKLIKDVQPAVGVSSAAGLANPPVTPGCTPPITGKVFEYPFSWVP